MSPSIAVQPRPWRLAALAVVVIVLIFLGLRAVTSRLTHHPVATVTTPVATPTATPEGADLIVSDELGQIDQALSGVDNNDFGERQLDDAELGE